MPGYCKEFLGSVCTSRCKLRRTPCAFYDGGGPTSKSRGGGGRKGKRPGTCRRRININVPGFTATRLLEPRRIGCMFTNTFLNVCVVPTLSPPPSCICSHSPLTRARSALRGRRLSSAEVANGQTWTSRVLRIRPGSSGCAFALEAVTVGR